MAISQYADTSKKMNAGITFCKRKVVVIAVAFILIISLSVQAQDRYRKNNSRFYRSKFKKQISQYSDACETLEKRRTQKTKSKARFAFFSKQKPNQYAEGSGTGRVLSNPNPKPKITESKPTVAAKPTEIPSPEKLEVLHHKEDEVLAENKLPPPTSEKHEQIRKNVQEHLKNKKDNEPIELAPLYFTFAEDEFSVVDMDPFLIAVEYALQGRIILIEGHTDNKGNADYNNKLSIKRVQKIRQLMIDMGVSDDNISIVGYGEGAAKHDNTSEEQRQLNRRVDFKAF